MNRFTFVDCATVDEALSQMKGDAVVKAGGIDLLDLMKDGIVSPPKLVSILNVRSLHSIGLTDRGLELGPLTTLSEIAEHPEIQQRYAGLSDAAGHAATPQVRNMATLGGNLMQRPRCWYFRSTDFDCRKKGSSDECHALQGENQYHAIVNNKSCAMVHPSSTAVPLLAMDAEVELTSKAGKRTVAMRDFYVAPEVDLQRETAVKPGELITAIRVPSPAAGDAVGVSEVWRERELRLAHCGCGRGPGDGRQNMPESGHRTWSGGPDADPCNGCGSSIARQGDR